MHESHMYVTDAGNDEVNVVNLKSGDFIVNFGSRYLYGSEGITIEKDGFVYITSHYSKIVVF